MSEKETEKREKINCAVNICYIIIFYCAVFTAAPFIGMSFTSEI